MKTIIKIKDDFGNDLVIGEVRDRTFRLERKRSKHFFVKHGGWAIDRKVAEGVDADKFVIADTENGKVYTISKTAFLLRAEPIINQGHREQLVVSEGYWEVDVTLSNAEKRRAKLLKAYNGG